MADQTARQRARRVALDAQSRMRARRAEKERRQEALALEVIAALAERDAVVAACEAKAGEALSKLTGAEGLGLAEAVQWCGGRELVTVREATRLRNLAKAGVADRRPDARPSDQ